ncbi:hypothetical protein [Nocardioides taihuensis]|uniref:Collagen-like protein n=1 Tax=Nocardioides taihuensis TaxID=1835606 RepID=A0ABW0BFS4_9ACTN
MNRNLKTGSVVLVAAAAIAIGGTSSAIAARLITGDDIARNTITQRNMADDSVGKPQLKDGVLAGITGPEGPAGTDGTDGKDGKDGKDGVANLESDGPYPGATHLQDGDNSTEKFVAGQPDVLQTAWVACPTGKTALGGGFSRADEGPAAFKGLQIVTSQPTQIKDGAVVYEPIAGDVDGSFVPNAWLVEGFNTGTTDLIVRPHVICATVAN